MTAVCRDLTVVIPTTGENVLHGCLSSILAGTAWPQELIVVDQGRRADVAAWMLGAFARPTPYVEQTVLLGTVWGRG